MGGKPLLTDVDEFKRFHALLTKDRPDYTPWYFRLTRDDKDPHPRIAWKDAEARIPFEKAVEYLTNRGNVGIAATNMDTLCIIDIDDIEVTPDSAMQPTLSIRSRKRIGRHYFYFTSDPKCKKNLPTEKCGEIRANWQYVVAPGSYVTCSDEEVSRMPAEQRTFAGRYSIENPTNPTEIVWDAVPPVFHEQAKKNEKATREKREADKKKKEKKKQEPGDQKKKSAMYDLTCEDIFTIPNKARFESEFHDSSTGKNTSYDGNVITCWRHNVTLTPLMGLAVLAEVADCVDAGKGMPDSGVGGSSIKWDDGRTIFKMWKFAKKEGIIPADDPIPPAALRWYAVENGQCKQNEIKDGWKLPAKAYNGTIALIEAEEGISAGRQKMKEVEIVAPPAVEGFYEVLNYEIFRVVAERYPDAQAEQWNGGGDKTVYEIRGDDFIADASELGVITPYIDDAGAAIMIPNPESLYQFVRGVELREDGAESTYRIDIRGTWVTFALKDLLETERWREKVILCGLVVSFDIKSNENKFAFHEMVVNIMNRAETVWTEELSGDDMLADLLMTRFQKLPVVDRKEDFVDSRNVLELDDMYLVSTQTVEAVAGQMMQHKELPEIRRILNDYLARNSKQTEMLGKRFSVWYFKRWGESA